MKLKILNLNFSIIKYPTEQIIPEWITNSEIYSITRTEEELSIVCPSDDIPTKEAFENIENDWKAIKVEGVLEFSLTGILSSLAQPLAKNKISIFALSTFNTDYLLVKSDSIDKAKIVLENEGHSFINT